MPERLEPRKERPDGPDGRSVDARLADHAAIERLADDLLPSLVSRLAGTGLGELEVREGEWRVRLRRTGERRATERSGRSARSSGRDAARQASRGHEPSAPVGHDLAGAHRPLLATSPAVGVFRARAELHTGLRVREGERVGFVDLLGVPQEVVAPADGVVEVLFVEDGDAVEYGQPLLAFESVRAVEHELPAQAVPVG
jgi:acetyl-CoA carboxylase biotin carboxyl carrier protein